MPTDHRERLARIRRFDQLVAYLHDELDWPIDSDDFEKLTFDYTSEELGIDAKNAPKIQEIKRLRPLVPSQPWGIFFVKFEPKRLPVLALRRILAKVALKKRPSANKSERQAWAVDDLLFVSNYGEEGKERRIAFAHFSKPRDGHDLPTLKVLGWDNLDTPLHLDAVARELTEHLTWPDDEGDPDAWRERWRAAFTLRHREVITTSKQLSKRLAELARATRDRIRTALAIETESGPLTKLMKAFQTALVHDLDERGFADMYAQTIAYGLLSARITNPARSTADDFATHMRTSPFLRELMETFLRVGGRRSKVAGPGIDFDELGVSEVVELLDQARMEAVVGDFGRRNPLEDPVIHFYEHFLAAYDRKQKVSRGVFYTPRPVVSYIVRSVDEFLRSEFGLTEGLADTTTWGEMAKRHDDLKVPQGTSPTQAFVQILDPATGTGTFLVEVIDLIHKTMAADWKAQGHGENKIEALWNDYVPKHLLPRLHGYELLMAPYAIAHLKIGLKLYETGYRFESDERAQVYLTNALEPAHDFSGRFEFAIPALAHEAAAVNEIKRDKRFTVVLGNPPYSGVSSNEGPWIKNLLRSSLLDGADSYFKFNGAPLDEPNTRWLNDDYVKFVRLAQAQTAHSGTGVVGLITNHSWLENPTFRGMRQSIAATFQRVCLLDLHGNTKKRESAPDGSKDENVFDIQQGVAISFLAARSTKRSIQYADLFGVRERKYTELQATSAATTKWHSLTPDPTLMLWRPFDASNADEYESNVIITEVFSSDGRDSRGSSWAKGLATTKDHLFISFDRDEAFKKIGMLASTTASDSHVGSALKLRDTPYFTIKDARHAIRKENWEARICQVTYRPFDTRVLYWHPELYDVGRGASSKRVMSHLLKPNLTLVTSRMTKGEPFAHAFVSSVPVEVISLSSKTSNNAFVFPLRFYPDMDARLRFGFNQAKFKTNLSPMFLRKLAEGLGVEIARNGLPVGLTPESIFHYTYAVFHSPGYRRRYAEFLKIDFPRLPLTGSWELFRSLAGLGSELVPLHLLESAKLRKSITAFVGGRNFEVGLVGWSDGTVWLDAGKTNAREGHRATRPGRIGFQGVPEQVWDFHIGGYQVCHKWLKDRKGRTLSNKDIAHYQKIVVALNETIRIMAEIDEVIEAHGGWPGAFHTASGPAEKRPAS